MLNTGTIVNHRYRIAKLLGQGGFGAVYRAWDINLNRACALKINLETSLEAQRQFRREADTLAALSHPNLPRVTDHFFVEGQGQFLVMDYVEGEDLEHVLAQNGRLSPEKALPIIAQVADALGYLHQQNPPIIHRDIKPANIRITADGRVFLVDFGLVKVYDQKLRTTIGARAVTPGYSPPEQYGQGNTDTRTDVYALAATLYIMLTGEEPQESVQRIVEDQLRPAHEVEPIVNPQMSRALFQAMSLAPSGRYQTIDEFVQSLKAVESINFTPTLKVDNSQLSSGLSAPIKQRDLSSVSIPPPESVSPFWWILGTAVFLSAIFFFFVLPPMRQQTAQEIAFQITRDANSAAIAQTRTAELAMSTATMAAAQTATQQTNYAQATATSQRATVAAQATQTARTAATATSAARATAIQQARQAATATTVARNNMVATIESRGNRVFGPHSGSLLHQENFLTTYSPNANLKNFVVEATFHNPYSTSQGSWDYGFLLRHSGSNQQLRLSIHSNRYWKLTNRDGESSNWIDDGTVFSLRTAPNTTNHIKLICRDDRGWLYVNGNSVAELDLSSRTNSGDIFIATGFYSDNKIEGEETKYTDFTVWSLP